MKNNLMPMISPLKTVKECFNTFTNLYGKKAPNHKRALKNKIWNLNMEKEEIVASFFTNISHVRDQLKSIGLVVNEDDLIQSIVDGLPTSWETFIATINGQDEQPTSIYFGIISSKTKGEPKANLILPKKKIFLLQKV